MLIISGWSISQWEDEQQQSHIISKFLVKKQIYIFNYYVAHYMHTSWFTIDEELSGAENPCGQIFYSFHAHIQWIIVQVCQNCFQQFLVICKMHIQQLGINFTEGRGRRVGVGGGRGVGEVERERREGVRKREHGKRSMERGGVGRGEGWKRKGKEKREHGRRRRIHGKRRRRVKGRGMKGGERGAIEGRLECMHRKRKGSRGRMSGGRRREGEEGKGRREGEEGKGRRRGRRRWEEGTDEMRGIKERHITSSSNHKHNPKLHSDQHYQAMLCQRSSLLLASAIS